VTVGAWFTTEYDEPAPALEVPGVVRSGRAGAFQAVDHFVRGRHIVGRISAGAGMLALKVRADGRSLRVRMELRLDSASLEWWEERAEAEADDVRWLPRLVLVRSQGSLRRAVLLARNHDLTAPGDVRSVVWFDLGPDEVPEDGLLVIEVADARALLPRWAADSFADSSALGIRVEWIEVSPVPDEPVAAGRLDGTTSQVLGVASTGGLVGPPTSQDPGQPRTPFVVINPPPDARRAGGAEVRCRLRPATRALSALTPPAISAWSQSLPGRAVAKAQRSWRKALRRACRLDPWAARPVSPDAVTARAVSLADGRPVTVRAQEVGGHLDLSLVPEGPVLVGVAANSPAARPETAGAQPPGRRRLVCGLVEVEI